MIFDDFSIYILVIHVDAEELDFWRRWYWVHAYIVFAETTGTSIDGICLKFPIVSIPSQFIREP